MCTRICRSCHGTGKSPMGPCSLCNGIGQIEVELLPFRAPTDKEEKMWQEKQS